MKKNLILLLITLVAVFGFSIKVNASGVTVAEFKGNDTVDTGEISFDLYVTGVSGSTDNHLHSFGGYVIYDPNYLEYVSFEGKGPWTAGITNNIIPGKVKIATIDWQMENGVETGSIGTIKFKALKAGNVVIKMDDVEATNKTENIHASFIAKHLTIKQKSIKSATVSGITNRTYNGKVQTQNVKVALNGKELKQGTDYSIVQKNNINAGTASVVITGQGSYGDSITKNFTINKAKNPMTVTAKNKKVKKKKVNKKKQVLSLITVSKGQGTVTYSKVSGSKKIKVNKTTGKITVKKKTKKGKYVVKVKVTANGNNNYNSVSKEVTMTIRVK